VELEVHFLEEIQLDYSNGCDSAYSAQNAPFQILTVANELIWRFSDKIAPFLLK